MCGACGRWASCVCVHNFAHSAVFPVCIVCVGFVGMCGGVEDVLNWHLVCVHNFARSAVFPVCIVCVCMCV